MGVFGEAIVERADGWACGGGDEGMGCLEAFGGEEDAWVDGFGFIEDEEEVLSVLSFEQSWVIG